MGDTSIKLFAQRISDSLSADLKSQVVAEGGETRIIKLIYYNRQQKLLDKNNQLTHKGLARLDRLQFERIKMSDQWDEKWRVVIFDIPQYSNGDRDKIRRLIKQIGFMHLQHSVWVHPMPCSEEIKAIQNTYGSSAEIIYFEIKASDIQTSIDIKSEYLKLYQEILLKNP